MQKHLACCAALLALGLGTVTAAHAQYGPAYPRVYPPGVPPPRAAAVVRAAGMIPLTPPVRRGPNYVVIASDRSGAQMRVVVDGYSGMIVRVRPAAPRLYGRAYGPAVADPYAPRPRVAIAPPEIKDPPPGYGPDPYGPRVNSNGPLGPQPPRNIPNARVATAPTTAMPHPAPHTVAAPPPQPAQTPLPRPRPALASNETADPAPAVPPTVKPVEQGSWPVPKASTPSPSEQKSGELKLVPVAPLD